MILSSLKRPSLLWVILFLFVSACGNNSKNEGVVVEEEQPSYERVKSASLLSSKELNHLIETKEPINLVDCRKTEQFDESHIPFAINIYRDEVSTNDTVIGGVALDKGELENMLSQKSINPEWPIVLYDDRAQCEATRLWWLLRRYGFKNVRILDGGFQEWTSIGFTLIANDANAAQLEQTVFKFQGSEDTTILAKKEDVLNAVNDKAYTLIDCRSYEEYAGETQKKGAYRAGHIPRAIHFDFWNNVDMGPDGEVWFLPKNILEEKYASIGIDKNDDIIVYCQSGVRSAQTLFVLTELLGYRNVRNYDGSWIEWSADESLPIVSSSAIN